MVGKAQLCVPSQKDVENERLVNRIKDHSRLVFLSLLEIFQMQSDLRPANIARKRQRNKQTSDISDISVSMNVDISISRDVSQTAQISLGIYFVTISNRSQHLSNGRQFSSVKTYHNSINGPYSTYPYLNYYRES
jgi:hypothetical protein